MLPFGKLNGELNLEITKGYRSYEYIWAGGVSQSR